MHDFRFAKSLNFPIGTFICFTQSENYTNMYSCDASEITCIPKLFLSDLINFYH